MRALVPVFSAKHYSIVAVATMVALSGCKSTPKNDNQIPVSLTVSAVKNATESSVSLDDVLEYDRPISYSINLDNPIFHTETIDIVGSSQVIQGKDKNTPKFIATEVASSWHYWMVKQAQTLFVDSVIDGDLESLYQPNKVDNVDVLDLGSKPYKEQDVLVELFEKYSADVDVNVVKKVHQQCIKSVGRSSLKDLSNAEVQAFYRNCSHVIKRALPGVFIPEIEYHPANNAYPYNDLTIKQHVVYQGETFDGAFLTHLKGDFSKQIQHDLRNPDVNQVLVSLPNSENALTNQRLYDDEYFHRIGNSHELDTYSLETLFNKRGLAGMFHIDVANVASAGQNNESKSLTTDSLNTASSKTLLRPLSAMCNIDPSVYHMANTGAYSRFQFDCYSQPKLIPEQEWQGEDKYQTYVYEKNQEVRQAVLGDANRYPGVIRSKATYLRFDDKAIATSSNASLRQTLIAFDIGASGSYHYKKVDENFPVLANTSEPGNTSIFALELLKRLPPNAHVAWIDSSSIKTSKLSSYVYHHGFLWEFPLKTFEGVIEL
ncbi:hypothetical protein [Thalassotalea sp. PS06]|uniref:hypothetical protein n=1 Tax=Thalassotalea sp. PS06 TaxID=2594005 RepID=UPI0011629870|nr:hypothetical protein [Thalassotalea sp. PS06]QDP01965.1 hypothetical protein FNC98_11810 [Thalassotalea sp. PS06]